MRISDWSSDVCSSDLRLADQAVLGERFVGRGDGERIVDEGGYGGRVSLDDEGVEAVEGADDVLDALTDLGCIERKRVVYGTRVSVRVDSGGRRLIHTIMKENVGCEMKHV